MEGNMSAVLEEAQVKINAKPEGVEKKIKTVQFRRHVALEMLLRLKMLQ